MLGDNSLWLNETIVPQISIDPDNGDVYALLTGNRNPGSPRNMLDQPKTGIWRIPRGGTTWTLLRGTVTMPAAFAGTAPWQYPIGGRGGTPPAVQLLCDSSCCVWARLPLLAPGLGGGKHPRRLAGPSSQPHPL